MLCALCPPLPLHQANDSYTYTFTLSTAADSTEVKSWTGSEVTVRLLTAFPTCKAHSPSWQTYNRPRVALPFPTHSGLSSTPPHVHLQQIQIREPGEYVMSVVATDSDQNKVASDKFTVFCKYVRRELRGLTHEDREVRVEGWRPGVEVGRGRRA